MRSFLDWELLGWDFFRKYTDTQMRIRTRWSFFPDVDCCFQMASDEYFLFFLQFYCHADTQIHRYVDRCSHLLAIAMTSNQLPEVVIGFAYPPHPWRISKLPLKHWRNKHQLRQESMLVIPVNPNHPAASAARKQTLSAAIHKSHQEQQR